MIEGSIQNTIYLKSIYFNQYVASRCFDICCWYCWECWHSHCDALVHVLHHDDNNTYHVEYLVLYMACRQDALLSFFFSLPFELIHIF